MQRNEASTNRKSLTKARLPHEKQRVNKDTLTSEEQKVRDLKDRAKPKIPGEIEASARGSHEWSAQPGSPLNFPDVPEFVFGPAHRRGDVFAQRHHEEPDAGISSDDDMTSALIHSKRAIHNVFRFHGRLPPKNQQPSVFFRPANKYVKRKHFTLI